MASADVTVIGWSATSYSETIMLVRFEYDQAGERRGFYFEVDVGAMSVRNVTGDAELEAHYAVPAPSGR